MTEEELIKSQAKAELWHRGVLSYMLHDAQKEIYNQLHQTDAQEVLIFCARQFGKTFLMVLFAVEHCLRNPRSLVKIAFNTKSQAAEVVSDTMALISRDAPPGLIKQKKSTYRWQIGKSELRLGSLEKANINRLRGGNATLFITEEGGSVKSEDFEYAIRYVIGPQLLRSGGRLVHVTTPSEEFDHYIHTNILPDTQASSTFFKYTIYQNPQLTPELLQKAIKLMGGEHTEGFRREFLCEVLRISEIQICPEFHRSAHVVQLDEPPKFCNYMLTGDYGGSRDKTVFQILLYDFPRDKIIVFDELAFDRNTPTAKIIPAVMKWSEPYPIKTRICDAPAQLLFDILTDYNFRLSAPFKDEWRASMNQVRLKFASNKIEVNSRCKLTIATLESGMLNKARNDFNRTNKLGHCDAAAALMYGVRALDTKHNPEPPLLLDSEFYAFRHKKDTGLDSFKQLLPKKRKFK